MAAGNARARSHPAASAALADAHGLHDLRLPKKKEGEDRLKIVGELAMKAPPIAAAAGTTYAEPIIRHGDAHDAGDHELCCAPDREEGTQASDAKPCNTNLKNASQAISRSILS
jgi:hypothetical protein